jgi:hypothetical protein
VGRPQHPVAIVTEHLADTTLHSRRARQGHLRVAALAVALAAVAVAVAWLVMRSEGGTAALPAVNAGPKLVSRAQLEEFANTLGRPLYWAGPKAGSSLELTRASGGKIFVRYLPRGVEPGDPRPDFLTVGTYAGPQSFAALKQARTGQGTISMRLTHHGLAVFDWRKPTSVYFGYPDADYQVEVFAPASETARALVLTGRVVPVDADAGSA